MNILSLFNGIGIGAQALKNLGVSINKNYISEIDKFANKTNEKHHPESIQLGSVERWKEWDIEWSSIDLVTAGFPCQSWSMAGQQLGDRDERGALFWVTLDIIANVLKHNPNAKWLMENVKMKKEFEEYITHHTIKALGNVEKILINSALLTAQNRNRYYWSNFKITQPEDRGILLKDILEDIEGDRDCEIIKDDLSKGHVANAVDIKGMESLKRVYGRDGKSPTLTTMQGGHRQPKVICENMKYRKLTPLECERLQGYPDNYTKGVSNTQRYKQIGNGWTLPVIEHIFKCMLE